MCKILPIIRRGKFEDETVKSAGRAVICHFIRQKITPNPEWKDRDTRILPRWGGGEEGVQ